MLEELVYSVLLKLNMQAMTKYVVRSNHNQNWHVAWTGGNLATRTGIFHIETARHQLVMQTGAGGRGDLGSTLSLECS